MIMKQMGFSSDDRDLDDYESVCLDDVWCEVRSVTGVREAVMAVRPGHCAE